MSFLQSSICILLLYSGSVTGYAADDKPPILDMPIACTIGVDCFVQNYVDADPSADYGDYHCGFLSYDEHKGTDFRIKAQSESATAIPVLAAADGVVRATRDGMDDINVQVLGRQALQGKDAGNSVVVVHGDNWETQYAHLKKGSVAVRPGQAVSRGTVLGQVGLSGNTEFLHLHFEIRHQGKAIDPFIGLNGGDNCALGNRPLWSKNTLAKISYIATEILSAGFTDHTLVADEQPLESVTLPANSPALVFWLALFGTQAGDEQVIAWLTPDGTELLHKTTVIEKNMAQFRSFVGKKRTSEKWAVGDYRVNYQLLRKQKPLLSKQFNLRVF